MILGALETLTQNFCAPPIEIGGALYRPTGARRAAPQHQRTIPWFLFEATSVSHLLPLTP